jgi:hypothetical protein
MLPPAARLGLMGLISEGDGPPVNPDFCVATEADGIEVCLRRRRSVLFGYERASSASAPHLCTAFIVSLWILVRRPG